jgi:glycosyltransferase involved in cell wall biosynthesis
MVTRPNVSAHHLLLLAARDCLRIGKRCSVRILCLHNYYQWGGGEDRVFEDEVELLRQRGHEVFTYVRYNRDIQSMSNLQVAATTLWSADIYREITRQIKLHRPDVMHCNNCFPLLSPSVYWAARSNGVAVLQALHNFRLLCPSSNLLRDGAHCEDCLSKTVAWPSIQHACYRNSRAASAVVAGMLGFHRLAKSWQAVNLFLAPSNYVRQKFLQAGFAPERVVVKPNLVNVDPNAYAACQGSRDYALFVGRLTEEKGIPLLLNCFTKLGRPLKIVGEGPLEELVRQRSLEFPFIEYQGQQPKTRVLELMAGAKCVVISSICAESFGLVAAEAMACGTPVVAARIGALVELVIPGITGYLFEPGDCESLTQSLQTLWNSSSLGESARGWFEENLDVEGNYQQLLAIYRQIGGSAQ